MVDQRSFYILDGSVAPGCDISSFTFSAPTVPVVFNPTIIPQHPHTVTDHSVVTEDHHVGQELATVQSRGTSPMLPASDSCPEDAGDLRSDDNTDENVDFSHANQDSKYEYDDKAEVDIDVETIPDENTFSVDFSKTKGSSNTWSGKEDASVEAGCTGERVECLDASIELSNHNRNVFKSMTEYNPFMDPQVLQAADGLELLSALAEKSAHVISDSAKAVEASTKTEDPVKIEKKYEVKAEAEDVKDHKHAKVNTDTNEHEQKDDITSNGDTASKKKSRVKCGYSFKPKMEVKTSDEEKKMTTFCGITIPEGDTSFLNIFLFLSLFRLELIFQEFQVPL